MTEDAFGWVGKLLRVDLTTGEVWTESSLEYGQKFMGARGIATRLAWEDIPPGTKAFDPGNVLYLGSGPLTGTSAPFSGRTTVCSLAPQGHPHEWFSRSSMGGYWGSMLKYAGYDGIVVVGNSPRPVYLWIDDDRVELRDAAHLWGQGIVETQQGLMAEHGNDVRAVAIGPAGENLCRVSIIATGTSSAAGQGGFGAVMGAKRLKAIAVRGTGEIRVARPEEFQRRTRAIRQSFEAPHGCPRQSQLDPQFVEDYGERFSACTQQCGARCPFSRYYTRVPGTIYPEKTYSGHMHCAAAAFGGGDPFGWKMPLAPSFELCQITNSWGLNQWELFFGMAPWLRRCHQEGMLKDMDGERFDFDSPFFWHSLVRKVVFREGIGDALAEGTVRAAEILGIGQEFLQDFYPGWGYAAHWDGHADLANLIVFPYWLVAAVQWAVDVRDPMSNGHGYAQNIMMWSPMREPELGLDWEMIAQVASRVYGSIDAAHPLSGYKDKAFPAVFHGHRSVMKDSLTVDDQAYPRIYANVTSDHFARVDDMEGPSYEYQMFVTATGLDLTEAEFDQMAERVINMDRALQIRNWHRTREVDETVVPYFEIEETWANPLLGEKHRLERDKFARLMDEYYDLRGWDRTTGWPTRSKLEELALQDVAEDLGNRGLLPEG